MNEPRRLLQGEGGDLEVRLLRAGLAEKPNPFRKRRTAFALASALGAGWSGVAWAGGQAVGVALAVPAAAAIGAVVVWAWYANQVAPEAPPTTSVPAVSTPLVPAPVQHEEQRGASPSKQATPSLPPVAPSAAQERVRAPGARPAPSGGRAERSFREEIEFLDEGRRLLRAGDARRTLAYLDTHRSRYPRGRLGPEVELLRIEALTVGGRMEEAGARARRFLAAHPSTLYEKRLRSLLQGTSPSRDTPARLP